MKLSPEQKRLLLIVTFVSAVYLYSLNDRLYMYPDSSYYYVIAKSLQDGDGFGLASQPVIQKQITNRLNNVSYAVSAFYPPVYPTMLAIFLKLFGDSLFTARLMSSLFMILSLPLMYLISKKYLKAEKEIFVVLLSVAFSIYLLDLQSSILIETMFLFLALFLLYNFDKDSKNRNCFLVILLLLVILLTKVTAVCLLISLLIYSVWMRDKKSFLVFSSIAAIFLFFSFLYNPSYLGWLYDFSLKGTTGSITQNMENKLIENFKWYVFYSIPIDSFSPLALIPKFKNYDDVLKVGWIVWPFILLGYVKALKRKSIFEVYPLVLTLMMIVITRAPLPRTLTPIYLSTTIYLIIGLKLLTYKFGSLGRKTFSIICVLIVFSSLYDGMIFAKYRHNATNPKQIEEYVKTLDWIKNNSEEDDILVIDRDFDAYIYSKRKTISAWELDKVDEYIKRGLPVRYIATTRYEVNEPDQELLDYIDKNNASLKLVYEGSNKNSRVYEFIRA